LESIVLHYDNIMQQYVSVQPKELIKLMNFPDGATRTIPTPNFTRIMKMRKKGHPEVMKLMSSEYHYQSCVLLFICLFLLLYICI